MIYTKKSLSYNCVLIIFIIINVLELFVPRESTATSPLARLPLQILHIAVLILMTLWLLTIKIRWNSLTKIVGIIIAFIIFHIYFFLFSNLFSLNELSPYLRLIEWLLFILFFYENLIRFGTKDTLITLYILTFILSIVKKILESSYFDRESLGGGDTASLSLLFIIPLILLCIKDTWKPFFIGTVVILIIISLRRTSIISLAVCSPFIFRYLRSNLKVYHLAASILIIFTAFLFSWNYFSDALIFRFNEIFDGKRDGSYGSGRSDFYITILQYWLKGDFSIVFGNGLASVKYLLTKKHGIEHAHNDFLEIIYTFGLIGLSIWFIFIYNIYCIKNKIIKYSPKHLNLLYILIISYIIIGLASGTILRATTLPFSFSISLLLYIIQLKKIMANDRLHHTV